MLEGVGQSPLDANATIPHLLFMAFQMMFAIITPALITGAFAERVSFKAWIAILIAWSLVVYLLLTSLIAKTDNLIATPNTLSETSNLLGFIDDPAKTQIFKVFRDITKKMKEKYIHSNIGVDRLEFTRLGLTDAILLEAAKEKVEILTADTQLYLAAMDMGYKVFNYNHIREFHFKL